MSGSSKCNAFKLRSFGFMMPACHSACAAWLGGLAEVMISSESGNNPVWLKNVAAAASLLLR